MKKILLTLIVCSLLLIPQLSPAELVDDCDTQPCLRVHFNDAGFTTWAGMQSMENQPVTENWHNTAFGSNSMRNIVGSLTPPMVGLKNTAFGSNTLMGLSIGVNGGVYNTAIGSSALMRIDDGEFNTAVGASAMSGNRSGFFNVAVGVETLRGKDGDQTGNYNTVIGTYSLWENSTGSRNTVVGTFAGHLAPTHETGWYDRPHLLEPVRGANNQTGNEPASSTSGQLQGHDNGKTSGDPITGNKMNAAVIQRVLH